MIPIREMNQAELAAYVQTQLAEAGLKVVLSGGAAVALYSGGMYVSKDIDFIPEFPTSRSLLKAAMLELGFSEVGRHFTHPETPYIVEFPAGPLSVGAEPVTAIEEIPLSTGVLRVISPTDCIKDRLSAYFHWNDLQALEQASLVAGSNKIDLEEIQRWAAAEEKQVEFEAIRERLMP